MAGLRDVGWTAVPLLIKLLKDREPSVRAEAISTLSNLAKYGVLYQLVIPGVAHWTQGELRETIHSAIPPLVESLKDSDYSVRIVAASSLGELGKYSESH